MLVRSVHDVAPSLKRRRHSPTEDGPIMRHILSRILFAAALALFAGEALAQVYTQAVTINATVTKSCAVTSATGTIDFVTAYDPNAAAPGVATGGVGIQCTKGTTYQWQIDDGSHLSGGLRRLHATDLTLNDYLNYTLRATSNGGTTWSAVATGMAAPVVGAKSTGRALPMTLGLEVTLPINQDVATDLGTYSDVVNVDISVAP